MRVERKREAEVLEKGDCEIEKLGLQSSGDAKEQNVGFSLEDVAPSLILESAYSVSGQWKTIAAANSAWSSFLGDHETQDTKEWKIHTKHVYDDIKANCRALWSTKRGPGDSQQVVVANLRDFVRSRLADSNYHAFFHEYPSLRKFRGSGGTKGFTFAVEMKLEKALPSIDRTPSPNRIRSSELTESGESNKVGRPAQLPPAGVPTPKKSLVFSPDSDTGAGAATAKSDTSEEGSPIAQKFNLGSPLPSGATLTTRERKIQTLTKNVSQGQRTRLPRKVRRRATPPRDQRHPVETKRRAKRRNENRATRSRNVQKGLAIGATTATRPATMSGPAPIAKNWVTRNVCVSIEEGKQKNFKARINNPKWPCKLNEKCQKFFKHGARCKTGRKAKRSPAKKKDPEDKKKA